VFQAQLGHELLKLLVLLAKPGDLNAGRFPGRISFEALLAGFQERLAPPVVEVRVDALAATDLRDALFAF
jgi:hypothetical protein